MIGVNRIFMFRNRRSLIGELICKKKTQESLFARFAPLLRSLYSSTVPGTALYLYLQHRTAE